MASSSMAFYGEIMPRELLSLFDYEARAREILPKAVFQMLDGGAFDGVTFRRTRPAFESVLLRPKMLRNVGDRDTSTRVLGHKVSLPVMPDPAGSHQTVHPDGELATARAAAAAGTIMVLSHSSNFSMEEVAAVGGGLRWFQLYLYPDREFIRECIQRAESAGYSAIVITVDYPGSSYQPRDRTRWGEFGKEINARNRFQPPVGTQGNRMRLERDGVRRLITEAYSPSNTWDTIGWVRSITSLPIVIKGILTGEDGRLCVEHGAHGVVVSNHGARLFDGTLTSIEALPEVVDAVEGRCEVLVDGGFRRGIDVLKALALGAKAVLIGRPIFYGLAVDGEQGVRDTFEILRRELDFAMVMSGVKTVNQIDRSLVTWPELTPF